MNGESNTRTVRAIAGFSVVTLLLAAATCAAPDAIPGAPIIEPPPPDGSDGSDAQDAPDAPSEPIAGEPVWRAGFGETTNDQKVWDVALDPDAKSIVSTMGFIVGISVPGLNNGMPYASGTSVPPPPPMPLKVQNVLIVKHALDSGEAMWATQIFNTVEIIRTTVDVDVDANVVVAGGFNGPLEVPGQMAVTTKGIYDAYIVKLDATGKPLWVHTFGGTAADYITDVATDHEGNIIVVGLASSPSIDFGDGMGRPNLTSKDIFVAKYDPDAKLLWAKRVGEAGATDTSGAANWREPTATVEVSRTDGSILVGGTYRGPLNFTPQTIASVSGEDGFVVKLDADGKGLWHVAFGGANGKQRVRSVAFGPHDEVFFTGAIHGNVAFSNTTITAQSFKNSQDLLIGKVGADGALQWVRAYGSMGQQVGSKIIPDEKERFFLGGSFTGSIDFFNDGSLTNTTKDIPFTPTDIFVSKFDGNGTPLWAHAFGDANPATVVGIQTIEGGALWKNKDNKAFVTFGGINSGSIDFNGKLDLLQSVGLEDAYLMSITY